LPSAGGFDPAACETPEIPQKGAKDEMGGIDKKDGAFTGLRFG
jgi:hypothetical protein